MRPNGALTRSQRALPLRQQSRRWARVAPRASEPPQITPSIFLSVFEVERALTRPQSVEKRKFAVEARIAVGNAAKIASFREATGAPKAQAAG